MDQDIRMRLKWVELFEKTGNSGLTCLRCGISRPTLRKWWTRYQVKGVEGLRSQSRRPNSSPAQKVFEQEKEKILDLRSERKLGARRIQNELLRLQGTHLGLATIQKVLTRSGVAPLKRKRRDKTWNRYSRPIPGDRVQMDTCKIALGIYQYTAIDDCTRYLVIGVYPKRTAANTLHFINERVLEEMPFPVQRIQTDRGTEFFAYEVQEYLKEVAIKFRPVRPRSPHLNGKVERVQKTVLDELYATIDLKSADIEEELGCYQHYYNWQRPHGAHNGKTPMDRYFEESSRTPFRDEVDALYDPSTEHIRAQNYRTDLRLKKLRDG
jgi:transposase InsO family protein